MAFAENLAQIRARDHHYIVAGRPVERHEHQEAFEDDTGWAEIIRPSSPRNPGQQKTRVFIKRAAGPKQITFASEGRSCPTPRRPVLQDTYGTRPLAPHRQMGRILGHS
jgi:hypothetical protein